MKRYLLGTQSKCSKFLSLNVKSSTNSPKMLDNNDISSLDITGENNFDIQQSFGLKL